MPRKPLTVLACPPASRFVGRTGISIIAIRISDMHHTQLFKSFALGLALSFAASSAFAACSGGLGRGWGSGKGAGTYEMAAADKQCMIGFANFIDDAKNTRIPATDVALTRARDRVIVMGRASIQGQCGHGTGVAGR